MKIKEFIIMPHTADAMGLIHKPGVGPNNRFGFKNVGNNKANELEETKEAPHGTYFTKTGNLEERGQRHLLARIPTKRIQEKRQQDGS